MDAGPIPDPAGPDAIERAVRDDGDGRRLVAPYPPQADGRQGQQGRGHRAAPAGGADALPVGGADRHDVDRRAGRRLFGHQLRGTAGRMAGAVGSARGIRGVAGLCAGGGRRHLPDAGRRRAGAEALGPGACRAGCGHACAADGAGCALQRPAGLAAAAGPRISCCACSAWGAARAMRSPRRTSGR